MNTAMLMLCLALYLLIALPVFTVIWSALVVAKWDDKERGYDLLEGQTSS